MTTLSVECFFKGMRADHDLPTVVNYPFRRARCVQDDMFYIYQKDFSYFTGPNSFYPGKIIKGKSPNIKKRPNKQSQISEGAGSKEEDKRREAVMWEFVGEYGKGVRQENVRSKTKELTGTLLYALFMHSVITASSEDCHAKQKMLMSYCRVELCGCKLFTTIRMSLLWDFAILAGYSLSRRSIRSRWRQFITKESAISLAERRCLWSELTQLHSNSSFGIHCRGFKHHSNVWGEQ